MSSGNNIKVKISYPYDASDSLMKMLPDGGIQGFDFILNPPQDEEKYDFWIVFNFLKNQAPQQTVCPPDNVIFIATEPYDVSCYPQLFLNQFGTVLTFEPSILKRNGNARLAPPLSEWFVGKTWSELKNIRQVEKTKLISVVSSNKTDLRGQRKRLKFATDVKNYFGEKIDLFGRGIRPFDDKWDVLAPYKYSIAIENSFSDDYFTEKINDCFLAHTFPLYYGCPNLETYFHPNSFERIDIDDVEKSIGIIERLLQSNTHYNNNLSYILDSKNRILERYNLFTECAKLISQLSINSTETNFAKNTIYQQMKHTPGLVLERLKHRSYKIYRKYI